MSCMNFPRIVVSMFVGAICAVQNPAGAGWGDLVGSGLLQGATQAIGSAIGNAVSGKDEQQGAQQGAQSVQSTAGRTYAASSGNRGLTLEQIEALPTRIAPLEVQLVDDKPEVLRAKPNIAIPSYAVSFLQSGDISAYAGGRGSELVQRNVRIKVALAGLDESDYRQIANEAYGDLLVRLRAAGISPITHQQLGAVKGYAEVARIPGNRISDDGYITGRHEQHWTVYGADQAPLVKGMAMQTGFAAVAGSQAVLKLVDAAYDRDAVVVQPLLVLDFVQMESSGSSTFTSRANVDANLLFAAHPRSKVDVNYAQKKGRGNIWGGLAMKQGAYSDEPFAVLSKVSENTGDQSLYQTVSAIGLGNMFKKSEGYAAVVAKDRYKALARAAYSAFNSEIVDKIVKARASGTHTASAASDTGGSGIPGLSF